jgi:hypothetical protein
MEVIYFTGPDVKQSKPKYASNVHIISSNIHEHFRYVTIRGALHQLKSDNCCWLINCRLTVTRRLAIRFTLADECFK